MSVNEGMAGRPADQAPPARTSAEKDSLRRVLGQGFLVLGRQLLSEKPDALQVRQAQRVVQQVQDILSRASAEASVDRSRMEESGPAPTLRTGVPTPPDRRVSATSRKPLPAPY